MRRNKLWAGLDVGVETTSVCIIDSAGEVLRDCACPTATRDVRHELATFRRSRFASVGPEASSGTHLARGFRSLGYTMEPFETRKLSKFLRVRTKKTDAGDANGIAEVERPCLTSSSREPRPESGQSLRLLPTTVMGRRRKAPPAAVIRRFQGKNARAQSPSAPPIS